MPGNTGPARLVKQAQGGNQEAFVELMERHKLSMIADARAILRNEEDVADALQETVLAAFRKLPALRQRKYFKTWLTRILINNCYEILRKRKTVQLSDYLEEAAEDDDREELLDVRAGLEALGSGDRLMLTLFYLEDMSMREIARALDISENAVKQRLARSRKHFRAIYGKEESVHERTGI